MHESTILRRAAILAALLIGAAFFVQPPSAAEQQLAQGSPPAASSPSAAPKPGSTDYVEARIKSLHDQLKITPAQEQQWSAVAQAMRDSAKATGALIAERSKKAKSMSAVDDLQSYQAIAKAHLDGINKLVPAFQALYAAMPDAQKKIADSVFARRPTRPAAKQSG